MRSITKVCLAQLTKGNKEWYLAFGLGTKSKKSASDKASKLIRKVMRERAKRLKASGKKAKRK